MARRISFSVPNEVVEEMTMTYREDHGESRTEQEALINVFEDSMFGESTHDLKIEDLGHICQIDDPPEEEEVEEEEEYEEDDDDEEEEDEEDDAEDGGEATICYPAGPGDNRLA